MSKQLRMLENEETPESAVRTRGGRRFMSDSGVHAKLAQAIASFGKNEWDECDDEAVTLVRLPAPQRHTKSQADLADEYEVEERTTPINIGKAAPLLARRSLVQREVSTPAPIAKRVMQSSPSALVQLPVQAVTPDETPVLLDAVLEEEQVAVQGAQPRAAASGYQLALEVTSDELVRIWARESATLGGRVFVWSEATESWVVMHDAHEALLSAAPHVEQSEPYRAEWARAGATAPAGAASLLQPATWFLAGFGVAAAFLVSFGVARGLGQSAHPASEVTLNDVVVSTGAAERSLEQTMTPAAAPQAKSTATHVQTEKTADIIPVTSLPLVSDSGKSPASSMEPIAVSALPLGGGHSVTAAHALRTPRTNATATGLAFNATRARQALSHASQLMQRCAGASDLSGSAVVTFAPSGAVNGVTVQSISGDVSKVSCVVSAFHSVRVPAFTGTAVSVKKSFGTGA